MEDPQNAAPEPDEQEDQTGSTYSSLAALFGKPPGAFKAKSNRPSTYSPFLPVMVVFLSLILLQTFALQTQLDQRQSLLRNQRALAQDLPQAETIATTVESLGRDLVSLSAKSAEARKIVAEFDIQLNPAAGGGVQ